MGAMVDLQKVSISEAVARLSRPFSLAVLASVDDVVVSVYICQDTPGWHRHIDYDELFWAYEGTIVLESEWGNLALRPGEFAVVPKGVGHRSSSQTQASVLLLRCGVTPGRKNGHRRLIALAGEQKLQRLSVQEALAQGGRPLHFHTAGWIEEVALQVGSGEGAWPVEVPLPREMLFMVWEGSATLESALTEHEMLHLNPGEMAAVQRGAVVRLSTAKNTTLVRLMRQTAPPHEDT